MQIFVINLKKQNDRRAFQQQQLKALNLDYELIEAIESNDISQTTYQKHYNDWLRPLKKAEIAC